MEYDEIYDEHREAFVRDGGRKLKRGNNHWAIPKKHARKHYPENIRWAGATNNYSTEISECYHIEFVKWAYEHTNHKEYIDQMITWLTRQDKICQCSLYLCWQDNNWTNNTIETGNELGLVLDNPALDEDEDEDTLSIPNRGDALGEEEDQHLEPMSEIIIRQLKPKVHMAHSKPSHAIAKCPPFPHMSIWSLEIEYNIPNLPQELSKYLIKQANPSLTPRQLATLVQDTPLPMHWQTLVVWTHVSVALPVVGVPDPDGQVERQGILAQLKTPKSKVPCFDTVFIDEHSEDSNIQVGVAGLQAVQLRLIFAASQDIVGKKNLEQPPASQLLAYVEWFSAPVREATIIMDIYEVKHMRDSNKEKQGGIVPLEWIVQPCPLVPRFPKDVTDLYFDEHTCLEKHDRFFINSFHDQATYQIVF
ncbi:hypothetical protein K439DRAFT_1624428 [Ramaria rubella]|nr:hypothetical protein K439DRAFT_1624428 [Ramaria rubella]